jgi:hypothetical protein
MIEYILYYNIYRKMQKRGQVTLFVIIAILIVAVVLLAIFLTPKLIKTKIPESQALDPNAYVSSCVDQKLEPMVETLAKQGGYLEKSNLWIFYNESYVGYLCYTNMNFKPCFNLQPFLKSSVEEQLKNKLQQDDVISKCISEFKTNTERKGWQTTICSSAIFNVTLIEGKVTVPTSCEITMSKAGETKKFEKIVPALNWPLYEFIKISREIIEQEISSNNFDPLFYAMAHPWVSIDKFRAEYSKIYTLRERSTGKIFMFAIRNYVQTPGI